MRFLPRPTYANVVATLALFIALGGVSYAATNLAKNSVGTNQIKKNAVTTPKIKKNAVTTPKIKKKAVDTTRIKKNAVTKAKVDPKLLASIDQDAPLKVLNGDGSVLGTYAGTVPSGVPIFQVIVDGGLYTYYPSGQLFPVSSLAPAFKNNGCEGTAYVGSSQGEADAIISRLVGGPTRVVFRTIAGGFNLGPISAWELTSSNENVAGQNLWEFDSSGTCVPRSGTFTGVLTALSPVAPPPDGVGPLRIG